MEIYHLEKVARDQRASHQARWLIGAAGLAMLIKLWLAWHTQGTLDIPGYQDHLDKIREFGAAAYNMTGVFGNPLNVPPFALHLVQVADLLTRSTGIPFRFWWRLPSIAGDAGSLWLVWQIIKRSPQLKLSFPAVLFLALCPASIMISGIHGNLDPMMVFLALLSLFVLTVKRSVWVAALVFGMALNIKVVPLIFAPALFFYLPDIGQRIRFFAVALGLFLLGSLPYIWQNPFGIVRSVFGHAGMYSHWGWTLLLVLARHESVFTGESGFRPPGVHGSIAVVAKYLLIAAIIAVSFWMNKQHRPPHLFIQFGAVTFLFMFFTPGFGAQYLSWLVPWIVALGLRPTMVFYLSSGAYLMAAYGCVSSLFGCDSHLYLGLVCWVSLVVVLPSYWYWSVMNRCPAELPVGEQRLPT
jgi:ALG6, ALG8 glycosyltransferase family